MRLYLASPLGFATSTRAFLGDLVGALERYGLVVHDPWGTNRPKPVEVAAPEASSFLEDEVLTEAAGSDARAPLDPEARRAARHTRNHAIGQANAEAIRAADGLIAVLDGVDIDSGTASEIGYAFALGKAIWGLRTDSRLTGDNEGAIVNLQVQYFIEASGGRIARSVPDLLVLLDYREMPGAFPAAVPSEETDGRQEPPP